MLSRFFTDKQGEERPIPIALKCKARGCCKKRQRKVYQQYSLESESDELIPEREAKEVNQKCSFDFGFSYVNNELAKNNRQYERIPMYQFECWRDGQQLRFYESAVFEYIIFIFSVYYVYSIGQQYVSLDLTQADALDQL